MTVLLIMIPLSLLFVAGAIAAFFWAVNHDQFDDMDSPALLPVVDDEPIHTPQEPLREPDASPGK